tara:strand:+ start:17 stop:733 length:717 start_codon:yes stop_codon:yes gene_type:complete
MSKETNQAYTTGISATNYHLHITGPISNKAEDYQDHLQIFRQANETDKISIHINSPGGSVITTAQYINAMSMCKAEITAHLEGDCMSAATFIFLSCDKWIVHKHTMSMFHNYTAGYYGPGKEPIQHHEAVETLCHGLMDDLYEGFLTPEEIESIKEHNKTIWISGDKMQERIQGYAAYLSKLNELHQEHAAREAFKAALPGALKQEHVVEELAKYGFVKLRKAESNQKICGLDTETLL